METDGTDGVGTPPEGQEQQPVETVETLQEKLTKQQEHARTWEKRAKENSAAAKRLADLEDAQKSEAEKTADRIAKAESESAAVPAKVAEALKAHLVALHEIDADDAELLLTGTEPDLLMKQVTRLLGGSAGKKKNHVSREGTNQTPADSEEGAFVNALFGGGAT